MRIKIRSILFLFVAVFELTDFFSVRIAYAGTCANPMGTVIDLSNAKTAASQGYYAKIRRAYDQGDSTARISVPDGYSPFDWNDDGNNDLVLGDPYGGIFDSSAYVLVPWADGDQDEGNMYILYGNMQPGSYVLEQDIGSTVADALWGTTIAGVNADDRMGDDLVVGDFNGDDCPDLFAEVPGYGAYAAAILFEGTNSGLPYGPQCFQLADTTLASATDMLEGNDHSPASGGFSDGGDPNVLGPTMGNRYFGHPLEVADLNKDGYDDIIVGKEANTTTGTGYYIYVYFGNAMGGLPATDDNYDVSFELDSAGSRHEIADVAAGDFNGDGCFDLAFSNYSLDSVLAGDETGAAYVLYNKTTGGGLCRAFQMTTGTAQDWDIVADMREGPTADLPGVAIYGQKAGQGAGAQVAFGDFDNDGIDDLLMGTKYEDGIDADGDGDICTTGDTDSLHPNLCNGGAFVVYGQRTMIMQTLELFYFNQTPPAGTLKPKAIKFVSNFNQGRTGFLAAVKAGDLNGDGYDEFVISGETNQDRFAAKAYILWGGNRVTGTTNILEASPRVTTVRGHTMGHSGFSTPAYGAGDVTGDGIDDLVITNAIDDTPQMTATGVPTGWYQTTGTPAGWTAAYCPDGVKGGPCQYLPKDGYSVAAGLEPHNSGSSGTSLFSWYGEVYIIEGGCR